MVSSNMMVALGLCFSTASAFQPALHSFGTTRGSTLRLCALHEVSSQELKAHRRQFLRAATLAPVVGAGVFMPGVQAAMAALGPAPKGTKVVVFGGNGFVGSRVSQQLTQAGAKVVSISRSGKAPAWAAEEDWVAGVDWIKGDAVQDDLSELLAGAGAVVSCIGVIGGSDASMQAGNGAANVAVVEQAAAAGVGKVVYVSVSKAVEGAVGQIALKGYFAGKQEAEDAINAAFPATAVVIAPTFIYGGTEFSATPPRVAEGYGRLVEGALSLPATRFLARLVPAVLSLALQPPVSVNALATAAAGAALGRVKPGRLDGTDAINAAAVAAASA